jgi:retron-type reverse transcriptase
LDNKKYVGAVLMDLSKAFDCVPHDLLIAKMDAYGFHSDTLALMFSYLKNRKQGVKVNNKIHSFLTLVSGVPQGSLLGPILFNLFINDIVLFFKNSELYNYADDNTISTHADSIEELISILQTESEIAIGWFDENEMIVNPDKFQAIIISGKHNDDSGPFYLKFQQL